jgi:predicted acylesterase/phospholipase RssA
VGIGTFICWLIFVEGRQQLPVVGRGTEQTTVVRHQHSADGSAVLEGVPSIVQRPHALSMVYGGGGVFGIGYGAGVAQGLARSGIPVASAPSLGTSAGAWVASAVVLGLTYDDFAGMQSPRLPTRQPVLYEAALSLFGDSMHHLVAASAIHLRSRRRHILDGARYPLADLAAASSAVPGLFPPHDIGGRPYIDGGMWSATSIDAAVDAQQVIVVAPIAGSVMGPIGRMAGFLLARELQTWRNRNPGATIVMIRPNSAIARLAGRHPLALFDADRARQVYPLAVAQGLQWGERMQSAPAA